MDFEKEMFDHLKKMMDKSFDGVLNSVSSGRGKKALDDSMYALIEKAGGTTDDLKVIRELAYTHMSKIAMEGSFEVIRKMGTENFIAVVLGDLMMAYRLGQFNSVEQEKEKV